jgi:methionyl-tRNA formyltransferase
VLNGESLKIWNAAVADLPRPADATPGQIIAVAPEGLAVATGDAVVQITQVQRPGGKRMAVRDFVRGADLTAGQIFDARPA